MHSGALRYILPVCGSHQLIINATERQTTAQTRTRQHSELSNMPVFGLWQQSGQAKEYTESCLGGCFFNFIQRQVSLHSLSEHYVLLLSIPSRVS